MKKIKLILSSLVIIGAVLLVASSAPPAQKAQADLSHTQIFPHIKTMMIDYKSPNTVEELQFMASHYDLLIGGSLQGYGDSPSFAYTEYYTVYVGNAEYNSMQAWATAHSVDFEAFFIHYSEETEAILEGETHVLPAGSRVPTVGWFGSVHGDLTSDHSRIVTNPGNPNFRAWMLDRLAGQMVNSDGVFVDDTLPGNIPGLPTVTRGGTISEYPTTPGPSYWDAILTMFADFKAHFGDTKVQVPNVSMYRDDPRIYPYVWGIFREAWNQPQTWGFPGLDADVAASRAAGVKANLIGTIIRGSRYEMPALANYYLVMQDTTYFFPFLTYVADQYGVDPRTNQWFGAVAYDVGQPKGARRTLVTGIDPSSPDKDTMTATVTFRWAGMYRLTDPNKNWTPDHKWRNKPVAFSNGYVMQAYDSGNNWVDLYLPTEIPTNGTYQLGTYSYSVLSREFDNALVIFRPLGGSGDVSDASAVEVALPTTADNPSGVYYSLNADGTLDPTPRTSLSLRNTDGGVYIKESALGRPNISKRVDKSSAQSGDTLTYTISYSNPTQNTFTNAILEDPIPAGTTYVANSATGGATFDGSKIIFNIGNLAAGAGGSIQFQVRVE